MHSVCTVQHFEPQTGRRVRNVHYHLCGTQSRTQFRVACFTSGLIFCFPTLFSFLLSLSPLPSFYLSHSPRIVFRYKTFVGVMTQPVTAALKTRRLSMYFRDALFCGQHRRVANSSPAAHRTRRQQGGAGEYGRTPLTLADWNLAAAAIEEENESDFINKGSSLVSLLYWTSALRSTRLIVPLFWSG